MTQNTPLAKKDLSAVFRKKADLCRFAGIAAAGGGAVSTTITLLLGNAPIVGGSILLGGLCLLARSAYHSKIANSLSGDQPSIPTP